MEDLGSEDDFHIQSQIGGNIPPGYVGIILFNCPVAEAMDSLHPAFKLSADRAMEVGMQLIHMGKMAERQGKQYELSETEADRCCELTRAGQCILKRGHSGNHAVFQEG